MTTVEKVARALFEIEHPGADPDVPEFYAAVGIGHRLNPMPGYCLFESRARAAIAAMREPTEAMIEAGDELIERALVHNTAGDVWRAMIDVALAEQREGTMSEPLKGTAIVDGRPVEWECPFPGFLSFGGIFAFRIPDDLDERAINAVVVGWHHGYETGKNTGRSILQNEFRNLMNCNR